MIACAIVLASIVLVGGQLFRDWLELLRWDTNAATEEWQCEHCGYIVSSTTIEGIVEGMRIHAIAYDCEEQDD